MLATLQAHHVDPLTVTLAVVLAIAAGTLLTDVVTQTPTLFKSLFENVSIRLGPRVLWSSCRAIDSGASRSPVPWAQLVEPGGGMAGDAGEDVGEPGLRIDIIILAVTMRLYMAASR